MRGPRRGSPAGVLVLSASGESPLKILTNYCVTLFALARSGGQDVRAPV
jgi:hypothetical protein